jgi:Co/Zn/Cd efflux system component
VSNLAVIAAAAAVWLTGAGWPDLLVAVCLVAFLMRSAAGVIIRARTELRAEAREHHRAGGDPGCRRNV